MRPWQWGVAFAVMLVELGSSLPALADEIAAYIVGFNETGGRIVIYRHSAPAPPIGLGMQLEEGDVLEITGAASATIDDGRGIKVVIGADDSPHQIGAGGIVAAARGEIGRLMEIVRWQAKEGTRDMSTRDDYALSVPLLDVAAPSLKLVEGTRELSIGWLDGKPPFNWSFLKGKLTEGHTSPAERRATITVVLTQGQDELRIADAAGTTRVFALEIVGALPENAAEVVAGAESPLDRIAAAALLTRIEEGAFMLEAAALLSRPEATGAETAFREALVLGERP